MKNIILFSILFFSSLLFISCSDLKNDISPAPEINTHGSGVFDKTSSNYHGKRVLESANKLVDCQQCHASDFSGGTAKISCASTNCHPTISVHKDGIIEPASNNFHAKYLKINSKSMTECSQCHGENYSGGLVSPTCVNCHSGIGVHKDGMLDPNSVNFHGKFIASKNWDLAECSQCHSANYSGGLVSASCLTCHTQTNGPEACNTCHGVFDDPTKIAPNVGAHFAHLYENELGKQVDCNQCHTVPNSFAAAGHIDSQNGAEIAFGSLTKLKTNSPGAYSQTSTLPEIVPNPSYNSSTKTCSNVYCHGYFKNGNTINAVSFNGGSSAVNCGSCHGNPTTGNPLPGGSHPVVQNCSFCHGDVVSVNGNTYTIIDISKHINGKLNFVNGVEETY